jgi:hypothetical protein
LIDCPQFDLGRRYEEARTLGRLGDNRDAAGDTGRAIEYWRRALEILDDLNHADAHRARNRIAELESGGKS